MGTLSKSPSSSAPLLSRSKSQLLFALVCLRCPPSPVSPDAAIPVPDELRLRRPQWIRMAYTFSFGAARVLNMRIGAGPFAATGLASSTTAAGLAFTIVASAALLL
jgi:hypothetical protein